MSNSTTSTAHRQPRLIAFYLPQFHPIPENDRWWGKGFTEWTNVTKAKPLFPGHYQPHLPSELGFYDLRVPETRQAQAALAREYGIAGFCYFHYWFGGGRRLLERPFDEVLASGRPDFPFCLCWANESWSRRWDGVEEDVLIQQEYDAADDLRHIRWLVKAFRDERYIRVAGRPLFLIYRAGRLPTPAQTAAMWREEAHRASVGDILLASVETDFPPPDPARFGFDAAVEFQPNWHYQGEPLRKGTGWRVLRRLGLSSAAYETHYVFDYATIVERMLRKEAPPYRRFPCVTPSWDNSARRAAHATIYKDATPEIYRRWLQAVIEQSVPAYPEDNVIFINAWNEWAEGNHLEPCQKWGRAYLEATRQALVAAQGGQPRAQVEPQATRPPLSRATSAR